MNQPQPVARSRKIFTEQENLADIRSRSCYKTLRFVINFAFAVFIASSVGIPFYLAVIAPVAPAKTVLLASGIAALIICIAGRQIALLLVDIADTLISEHNRNRNR